MVQVYYCKTFVRPDKNKYFFLGRIFLNIGMVKQVLKIVFIILSSPPPPPLFFPFLFRVCSGCVFNFFLVNISNPNTTIVIEG